MSFDFSKQPPPRPPDPASDQNNDPGANKPKRTKSARKPKPNKPTTSSTTGDVNMGDDVTGSSSAAAASAKTDGNIPSGESSTNGSSHLLFPGQVVKLSSRYDCLIVQGEREMFGGEKYCLVDNDGTPSGWRQALLISRHPTFSRPLPQDTHAIGQFAIILPEDKTQAIIVERVNAFVSSYTKGQESVDPNSIMYTVSPSGISGKSDVIMSPGTLERKCKESKARLFVVDGNEYVGWSGTMVRVYQDGNDVLAQLQMDNNTVRSFKLHHLGLALPKPRVNVAFKVLATPEQRSAQISSLSEPDSNSEHEPTDKKKRIVYLDGPAEDEETAERKLKDAGFDRGNYTEVQDFGRDWVAWIAGMYRRDPTRTLSSTPLIHFCRHGDIKMCRYLLQKGASVHKASNGAWSTIWNPMHAASIPSDGTHGKRFDICKLLFRNGAPINPLNESFVTLLRTWATTVNVKCIAECKWFIRNGALSNDDGNISQSSLRRDLQPETYLRWDVRTDLLSWAENELKTHRKFQVFLLGTLLLRNCRQNQSTHLTGLSGKAGILEHIGNYVGVVRGKDLRLFRQLAPLLAQYISDTPHEHCATNPTDGDDNDDDPDL